MTITQLKRLMKERELSQAQVADMMGVTQPTVSDILTGEHDLSERNARAVTGAVARGDAVTRIVAEDQGLARCVITKKKLEAEPFVEHLSTCPGCMAVAFFALT